MPTPIDLQRLDRLRARSAWLLLGGASIGSTAFIISMTVTALVAQSITGDATWSGVPVAATVLGTAVGTSLLSAAMARWGRGVGLVAFYAIAGAGGLVACAATVMGSLPLLVAGVSVVGVGNSANALTRYVAADLQTPARRATTVGWIVWAGTVGAVIGPNLLSPSDRIGATVGLPPLAGAYVFSALTFFAAAVLYLVLLRPDPSSLAMPEGVEDAEGAASIAREAGAARLFRAPRVQVSVVTLVCSHVVMVLIMTMTPLHIRAAGHGLDIVGLVASSHIVGMFLFAPLTGWLVDRIGALPVIVAGQATLLAAALGGMVVSAAAPAWIGATLFLLGLGWNMGFVAGSASLTRGIATADRGWLQGRTDSMVWVAAAGASLLSSLLFSTVGFSGLSAVGACAIVVSATTIAARRQAMAEHPVPVSVAK